MPYPALQSMLDAGAPPGQQNYWKSRYLGALPDAVLDAIVEHGTRMPPGLSVDVKTAYDPENVFRLNQNVPPRSRTA